MVSTREITIDWTATSSRPGTSVLHFTTELDVADQRAALQAALTGFKGLLNSGTSWSIASSGREFDVSDGTLTGAWTDATSQVGSGSSNNVPVANAAQVLVRLQGNTIINGRFVAGRWFIPGLGYNSTINGEVSSAAVSSIELALANLVVDAGIAVWHRPNAKGPGALAAVTDLSVWKELAVLRRRR